MIEAKKVHIVGLGGIGTSAVAKYFLAKGAKVSGTDVHKNAIIEEVVRQGAEFHLGHFADHVASDCDLFIYSRAIPVENVERLAASERGIPSYSYPEFLGELAKSHKTIAVSGTNGKSTTTAMIASILIEAGFDPTVFVGTQVPGWEHQNMRLGNSSWLVVEACEHMGSMLRIGADFAVITNIAPDHLDYYRDLNHIVETFELWLQNQKPESVYFLNADDGPSKRLKGPDAHYFQAKHILWNKDHLQFEAHGEVFAVPIPGIFNAHNASAAVALAQALGIDMEVIKRALAQFKGTWRRFERIGEWKGAKVFSDYAHHPDGVKGALEGFRSWFPHERLVVVFEPHQHSRTKELFENFASAFDAVDMLIMAEIYEVAGRNEDTSVSAKTLAQAIEKRKKIDAVYFAQDYKKVEALLRDHIQPNDILVFMGAGSIDEFARTLTS